MSDDESRPTSAQPSGPRRAAHDAREGAVAMLPIVVGVAPFGVIAGVTAVEVGLGLAEAVGLSVVVFAGASQLAALDLLGREAPIIVAVATALVINARLVMYSASLAPDFATVPRWRRILGAYAVTDQSYALCMVRFRADPDGILDRWWYFIGSAIPLWLTWQVSTVVGVVLGDRVPDAVPLGFALPLAFLSLLVPTLRGRPSLTAALTAATVATVAADLPANAGMPLAAVTGILAGWLAALRGRR